jgi:hypothetical protein
MIDFSPTAVDAARRELRRYPAVRAIIGEIPGAIPDAGYDLVVASEILDYLEAPVLTATLSRLEEVIAPAGRLVAVHWRPLGPERPWPAAAAHARLRALPWLRTVADRSTRDYLLHVLER